MRERRIPAVRHRKTAGVSSRHGFREGLAPTSPVYVREHLKYDLVARGVPVVSPAQH